MILVIASLVCCLAVFTFVLQSRRAWAIEDLPARVRLDLVGWRFLDMALTFGTFTLILAGRLEAAMLFLAVSLIYSLFLLPRALTSTIVEAVKTGKVKSEVKP